MALSAYHPSTLRDSIRARWSVYSTEVRAAVNVAARMRDEFAASDVLALSLLDEGRNVMAGGIYTSGDSSEALHGEAGALLVTAATVRAHEDDTARLPTPSYIGTAAGRIAAPRLSPTFQTGLTVSTRVLAQWGTILSGIDAGLRLGRPR